MGTGAEFRPSSAFLPTGEIGVYRSTLRRQRPKGLCQRERGADALVSVIVIEDREQGAIHRSSVGEDAHWYGAPCDFEPLASQNRSDHFAVRSKELDHFGQACEAEANGSASVPAPASGRRDDRKRSSRHLAVLRSVVSNPSVNRS
jgi:hypothetical protein